MRALFLACLFVFAAVPASADECDALAGRIAAAGGARKAGKRIGPSVEIRTASGVKLDLTCRGADSIVQAISTEPQPSATYFQELVQAGQYVIGEPPAAIQAALTRAYEKAVRERTKSFIQQNGWSASCYADTGSGSRTLCSLGRIPPG